MSAAETNRALRALLKRFSTQPVTCSNLSVGESVRFRVNLHADDVADVQRALSLAGFGVTPRPPHGPPSRVELDVVPLSPQE